MMKKFNISDLRNSLAHILPQRDRKPVPYDRMVSEITEFLQKYHPYGIQEVSEVFKVSASHPVRLECTSHLGEYAAMHIASGRVRRKNGTYWLV